MIKSDNKINVLSYNRHQFTVPVSPNEYYTFKASVNDNVPSVIPMTIEQIKYVNNGIAFKGGFLFFEKDVEEDMYKLLNINDWEYILNDFEIENIILNPTEDGLKKLIAIQEVVVFDRVKSISFKLNRLGNYDISTRVNKLIETRYKELQAGKIYSNILIEKRDIDNSKNLMQLEEENKTIKSELMECKKMLELLMQEAKNNVTENSRSTTKSKSNRTKPTTE